MTEMIADDINLASKTAVSVLITAESREQRETCARLIHAKGGTADGPFVTSSFGTAPAGADQTVDAGGGLRRQFDRARGGTLFIDDIAALTTTTQGELCGLLEEYSGIESATTRAVARMVRVIAGASRHLDADRQFGAFCEPLFYRLNVVHVDLLPKQARDAVTS